MLRAFRKSKQDFGRVSIAHIKLLGGWRKKHGTAQKQEMRRTCTTFSQKCEEGAVERPDSPEKSG